MIIARLSVALLSSLLVTTSLAADRPTAVVDGKTYPIYDAETEARPVKRVSPILKGSRDLAGRGGDVTVGAVVDGKGNVRKTYIVEANAPGDVRAAIVNAVEATKFPAIRDPATQTAISYVVIVKMGLSVAPAQAPSVSPALADIIFEPQYFRSALGRKALILSNPETGKVAPPLLEDLKAAGLIGTVELIPLPKDAVQPKVKSRVAPVYPEKLRRNRMAGTARFLYVIGADGAIKGIYCAAADRPEFAVAGAAALVQWRYEPARIDNTPVPMIVYQMLEFSSD